MLSSYVGRDYDNTQISRQIEIKPSSLINISHFNCFTIFQDILPNVVINCTHTQQLIIDGLVDETVRFNLNNVKEIAFLLPPPEKVKKYILKYASAETKVFVSGKEISKEASGNNCAHTTTAHLQLQFSSPHISDAELNITSCDSTHNSFEEIEHQALEDSTLESNVPEPTMHNFINEEIVQRLVSSIVSFFSPQQETVVLPEVETNNRRLASKRE